MKKIIFFLSILELSSCVRYHMNEKLSTKIVDHGDYVIDTSFLSKKYDERIQFLIFHYTAADDKQSLHLLTDGNVSAHYLITSNPNKFKNKPVVLQLVPENKRAWHAGISSWAGRSNINDTSIGIEIVNDGFHKNFIGEQWIAYNQKQIILAALLAKDIISRYKIKPQNVLSHSDISPLRKIDPGPQFPWYFMSQHNIGAWPDAATVTKYLHGKYRYANGNILNIQIALAAYGYNIPQTGKMDLETQSVIKAFQMHFRPINISGFADIETEAIALALVEKYCTST